MRVYTYARYSTDRSTESVDRLPAMALLRVRERAQLAH
jgi:hypothetical protein